MLTAQSKDMTKKGFTLMELLVSIFITGMVMLSLVAMWKTSSNHTAQAQRQAIIKNENTGFLRKFYSDFVSANEVICPWSLTAVDNIGRNPCIDNEYIAVKNASVDLTDNTKLVRTTKPACSGVWAALENTTSIQERCVKPSYTVYRFENDAIFKCSNTFLDGEDENILISTFVSNARNYCKEDENKELIMPYISSFTITVPVNEDVIYPELLLEYTVQRNFGSDIPPVFFKFKRYFVKKKGR